MPRVIPAPLMSFLGDRIRINSLLIVASFLAVLLLSSQSAASYPTYLLAIGMLVSVRAWDDVFRVNYFRAVLVLVAYLSASSLWSTPFDAREVASAFVRSVLIVLFVVSFAEAQVRGHLRGWLCRSLAVVALVTVIFAVVAFLDTPEYRWGGRFRGLGQLDNPNITGMVYGAALLFVIDLLVTEESRIWRAFSVLCAAVLLITISYTGSRAAWFSVAMGIGIYVLSVGVSDRQKFIAAVASLAVVLTFLVLVLLAGDGTHDLLLPRSDSYRPDIWAAAIAKVTQGGLLFGLGIATPDQVSVSGIVFEHPHSIYVSILFQGGVIGFGLFAALIGFTIWQLFRNYGDKDAKLALALICMALTGYSLDGHELIDKVSDVWFLFWFPVAICVGLNWRESLLAGPDD